MVYSIERVLQNTRQKTVPGNSLEQPLAHLVACHGRIEERLQILEKAAGYLRAEDEARRREALEAIGNSLRYFDTSGVHHTEDEEQSLFPRLRQRLANHPLLSELEAQHREAEQTYDELVSACGELRAAITPQRIARYETVVARLVGSYRPHIALEDRELIPLASRLLTAEEIVAMREEMRQRRGR